MKRRPLLIAAFGFTFGVLFGPGAHPWIDLVAGLACVAIARRRQFRFPIMYAVFLGTGAFLLGLPVAFLLPAPATIEAPSVLVLEAGMVEAPDRGLVTDRLLVDVTATATAAGAPFAPARGRVLLRVPHGACGSPGGRIRVLARLSPRRPGLMPPFRSERPAVRRGADLYGEALGPCISVAGSWRALLSDAFGAAITAAAPKHAHLLAALATGDRAGGESGAEVRIVEAGLGHLLELSGLGMAVLFFLFFHALRRRSRLRSQLAIPLLALLVLIQGATPSSIRVALLLACLLLPSISRGRADVLDSLSLAVIVVLAISPAALGDVRFQLAFAGISAALRLYPPLAQRLPALPRTGRAPLQLLLVAAMVTIGTAPLAARLFDRVSLLSLAVSPVALIALVGVIGPLSVAGGVLAMISPVAGAPLLAVASTLLDALLPILPGGERALIPTPTILECVAFYVIVAAFAAPVARRRIAPALRDPVRAKPGPPASARFRSLRAPLALALAFAGWVGISAWLRASDRRFEAAVLPAESGLAYVVRQSGGTVLARPGSDPRTVIDHLRMNRHTRIDVLIADADLGRALAHQFPVGEIRRPADGLRVDSGAGTILFAETATTAAGAVVHPDGRVTVNGDTLHPLRHGMIRLAVDDGRLTAIPHLVP